MRPAGQPLIPPQQGLSPRDIHAALAIHRHRPQRPDPVRRGQRDRGGPRLGRTDACGQSRAQRRGHRFVGLPALERARALDAAKGPKGPLHGVPITIKINIDQKGEASSNGVVAFKDLVAPGDAPLVKNLLDAGAVVIGRTNVPTFAPLRHRQSAVRQDLESVGAPCEPGRVLGWRGRGGGGGDRCAGAWQRHWRVAALPGGRQWRSHGQAGVGRVAVYNPSQTAERGILAQQMSAQGLLARSARDLHLAMPAMIAADPRDPFHVPLPWRGPALAGPMKVGFSREAPDLPLHPEVEKALLAARDALADAGYVVEEISLPSLREIAFEAGRRDDRELSPDGRGHREYGSLGHRQCLRAELPPHPDGGDEADAGEMLPAAPFYARQWSVLMAEYPLFLSPFLPVPFYAPGRDAEGAEGLRESIGQGHWSTLGNYLGLPAGVVPAGLGAFPRGTEADRGADPRPTLAGRPGGRCHGRHRGPAGHAVAPALARMG